MLQNEQLFSKQSTEIVFGTTQSLLDKEVVFSKPDKDTLFQDKMQLTSETEETLIDWFNRKLSKNPFGALILLSARLTEISGSAWGASIKQGELILLNVQIEMNIISKLVMVLLKQKQEKTLHKRSSVHLKFLSGYLITKQMNMFESLLCIFFLFIIASYSPNHLFHSFVWFRINLNIQTKNCSIV